MHHPVVKPWVVRLQTAVVLFCIRRRSQTGVPTRPTPGRFGLRQKRVLILLSLGTFLHQSLSWLCFFVLFCFFLSRATPEPYGSSQARGGPRAAAAGLHHSHSNARSLTHWARPGIQPLSSWRLVGFVTSEPQWELIGPAL